MTWHTEFQRAFNPESIAVVGVSRSGVEAERSGTGGAVFVAALKDQQFPGRIYPINPSATELQGLKCYPSLRSLPEPVDLVIISVARQHLLAVLEECIVTNSKNVHIYTSGFEETGNEEGAHLGKQVREVIERGGLRVLGPNCLGVFFVPKAGVAVHLGLPRVSGDVAFISQSGGHCDSLVHYGNSMGLRFSKIASVGNAYVFDGADVLEYFAADPESRFICMYLEGIRDGRKLIRLVKETNPHKPIIILKGGMTEQGARAVASHTASLAGSREVWDAFFRQTGAIRVHSIEEMAEVTSSLRLLSRLPGRRAVVIGAGGGNSVASADACGEEGLEVPRLGDHTIEILGSMVPEAGTSVRNPIDSAMVSSTVEELDRTMRAVFADPVTDLVILNLQARGMTPTRELTVQEIADWLVSTSHEVTKGKPIVIVLNSMVLDPRAVEQVNAVRRKLLDGGVPVFPTLRSAARALSRHISYYEYQEQVTVENVSSVSG
jgi:acyl-CoA synthetase (NDP forming)